MFIERVEIFMNVQQTNNQKGFTIIEVVLVLAIAALIFLMVFIALPSLQRSQRDTQRRDDLGRISTQINSYQSSNRGSIPSTGNFTTNTTGFVSKYLGGTGNKTQDGGEYADPTAGAYTFTTGTADPTVPGTINYQTGRLCDTDGATKAGSARNYVLRTVLEGQSALYCVDNH